MKVRVDFTLDIPMTYYEELAELAGGAETTEEVRGFLKEEAKQYLMDYLADNGVRGARVVREA